MDTTILVAGIDSVIGANCAASLSSRYRIVGLSFSGHVSIEDCESDVCRSQDSETIAQWLQQVRPEHVLYCGPTAQSAWLPGDSIPLDAQAIEWASNWAAATQRAGCGLTFISSDAIFTGPWIFHTETSDGHCPSTEARLIRTIEDAVREQHWNALIVRTNAFGWAPGAAPNGPLERLFVALEAGTASGYDCLRHATPILASDLADILCRAWEHGLTGTFHVGGAERVSAARFVERLAVEFSLPIPHAASIGSVSERPVGFGRGETSLHTGNVRKALRVPMPLLADGLRRLREQREDGYYDCLHAPVPALAGKVA